MNEPRSRRALRWLFALCGLLLLAAVPVQAQLPPRLTAGSVADQLEAASRQLAARADGKVDLAATAQQLQAMAQALRGALAAQLAQPLSALDDRDRGRVLRAHAAGRLAGDFLGAAGGCRDDEAAAMAKALALSVSRLAQAPADAKPMQATIGRVEGADHAAVFALHASGKPVALALVGDELADPQCGDPRLFVTDAQGSPASVQPRITGVLPGRVELEWPANDALPPGSYLLHLQPQRKAFLVGCTAQPEAAVAVQLVAPARFTVDYVLQAGCGDDATPVALGSGRLPPLAGYGTTAVQAIDTTACAAPRTYRISATVGYADGASAAAGPFEQSADADLTVGLPGGLSLSWYPSVRKLFVRAGAPRCQGIR